MKLPNEDLIMQVYELAHQNDWDGVIETLKPFIQKEPKDHWYNVKTGIAYYQKYDFDQAFKYISVGLHVRLECPMGLFVMANILKHRGQTEGAMVIWEGLANSQPEKIDYGVDCVCCHYPTMARTLVADSKIKMAETYKEQGFHALSERYRNSYLRDLSEGVTSLYSEEDVEEMFED